VLAPAPAAGQVLKQRLEHRVRLRTGRWPRSPRQRPRRRGRLRATGPRRSPARAAAGALAAPRIASPRRAAASPAAVRVEELQELQAQELQQQGKDRSRPQPEAVPPPVVRQAVRPVGSAPSARETRAPAQAKLPRALSAAECRTTRKRPPPDRPVRHSWGTCVRDAVSSPSLRPPSRPLLPPRAHRTAVEARAPTLAGSALLRSRRRAAPDRFAPRRGA
jgi:hypothetical protein